MKTDPPTRLIEKYVKLCFYDRVHIVEYNVSQHRDCTLSAFFQILK